ncbi:MAG: ribbon-helix-helix domain-containing protein [Christensenellaceae bacterium]|jgi:hypothetical protein|nr:ribbon-helix-helix domain-containing protein [Christensenellaceae bacterium]
MLKRKDLNQAVDKFVKDSASEVLDEKGSVEDLHKYVRSIEWPISKDLIYPSLAEGSVTLSKNMTIYLKENEWNSIDRHVKALGRNKSEWVRYALLRLIQEEQIYCFKNKKDK